MHKLMLAATAALALLAAPEARAESVWNGELVVKTATAACAGAWATGDFAQIVYRPAGIGTNGADTFLSVIQRDNAMTAKVVGAGFSALGQYEGTAIDPSAQASSYSGGFQAMTTTPAVVTAATKTLVLAGILKRVGDIVGCNLNFTAVLVKRP